MDAGEFAAEPLGDLGQYRIERWVAGDAVRRCGAGSAAHHKERLAKDRWIGAGKERLRHRHSGTESRLQHREFLQSIKARRHAGFAGRPQHQVLRPVQCAARKPCVEPPILLNGAAGKRCQSDYLASVRAACSDQKLCKRDEPLAAVGDRLRSRRRRARHRPR